MNDDKKKDKKDEPGLVSESKAPKRPKTLEAAVVRFQNNNEKWMAVVGLLNNKPYEIFTGRIEDVFTLPAWVDKGWVIKSRTEDGTSRYDFQYQDKEGYKVTFEGLSRSFNQEYWNYAKLISGVLRHGMPLPFVVHMVSGLNMNDEYLNTWKNGVVRALKKFIPDGTAPVDNECPDCGQGTLVYEEGCLNCKSCGHTKCA